MCSGVGEFVAVVSRSRRIVFLGELYDGFALLGVVRYLADAAENDHGAEIRRVFVRDDIVGVDDAEGDLVAGTDGVELVT